MKVAKRDNINASTLSLGEFMHQLRKDAGVLQKDLAKQLGVQTVTYSAYENGRITPTADKLYALAQYYDINVELLLSKVKASENDAIKNYEPSVLPAIKEAKEEVAMMEELVYYFRNLRPTHKKAVYELAKSLCIS